MRAFEQRGTAILTRTPPAGRVAEIGVLLGRLSAHLLLKRADISLLMVDNWATADEQPAAYRATRDDHAQHDRSRVQDHERQARAAVKRFGNRAQIVKASSVDAAAGVDEHSLDVCFIDADHSYEGVTDDLKAWLGKVKPGGWIGGHDYRNPDPRFRFGVTEAVDDWATQVGTSIETDLNFTWWAKL